MSEMLDEKIEELAFGQTAPKVDRCLGLYLSPDMIYISESHIEPSGKIVVDQLIRVAVPPPEGKGEVKGEDGKTSSPSTGKTTMSTNTLNTDFLTDNAKLQSLIRQSMSQVRWNSKYVMVTLSHHLGLLRYFTMPGISKPFWKSAIPVEAKKYIPIQFDLLAYDYQVTPLPPDASNKARQGALIAVTQKKNLGNITSMLEGLGLQLVGMEVAPCSVLRLWQTLEKSPVEQPYCQVHFDGGNVRVLLSDKGIPIFFREIFLGQETSLADQRKIDLGGCLNFATKQLSIGKLSAIKVSGSSGDMAQWVEAFKQETGLPVSLQDTPGLLSIKGGDWGGFASVGAALRFARPKTMTLDLGAVGRVTDDERRMARDIFGLSFVLVALLVVVGLLRSASYSIKSGELKKYKRDYEIEQVFQGKSTVDIEGMLKGMREQVDATSVIGDPNSLRLSAVFKDVVESLPERAWITQIEYRNPLLRATNQRPLLEMMGHAVGSTTQEEQDLSFRLRDQFSTSKSAQEVFNDVQMSVNRTPEAEAEKNVPGTALDRERFEEKRELRTSWRLTAGWKRN
jgi:hypothetical protein